MTRCCPLSHVTSVIDAEWFCKNACGEGGVDKVGGGRERERETVKGRREAGEGGEEMEMKR